MPLATKQRAPRKEPALRKKTAVPNELAALFAGLPKIEKEEEKSEAQRRMILDMADSLFRRHGLRRVTMDELARAMRISKKTLYAHFAGKEDIVQACVDRVAATIFKRLHGAFDQDVPRSTLDRLSYFQDAILEVGRLISSEFISDLKLEYPHIWEAVDERRKRVAGVIESFYEEGIRTGEINPHINPKVARRVHLALMQGVLHPDVFAAGEFSPAEAIETVLTIFHHGILGAKVKRAN